MSQRAQRIVVTGGAGFIGSHLVDRLLADGANSVVVFDNLSRGRLENLKHLAHDWRLEFVQGDVRDPSAVASTLNGADLVYHLAAQPTVIGATQDGGDTFSTNVVGTYNVLRAAVDARIPRVLFASSSQVYGEPINLPVSEESPLLPINSFGASKVAGEAYCRAFRREYGLQVPILRLAKVYGPRDVDRLVSVWLQQAVEGQELHVHGGKRVLDLVWVDQVVDALERAGALDGPVPPINVGTGTGTRILDLARRISRLADRHVPIRLQPARPVEVTRFIAKIDRMRDILQIEPPLDPLAHLAVLLPGGAESDLLKEPVAQMPRSLQSALAAGLV